MCSSFCYIDVMGMVVGGLVYKTVCVAWESDIVSFRLHPPTHPPHPDRKQLHGDSVEQIYTRGT